MQLPNEPVRIIYAKLTSTGAYDVVAKTTNIDLTTAREIAEKLQLGNPPFGVRIEEEIGYANFEGGHIVVRYTTYGWNDGRPAPPMTDAVWVDDATFDRVRRNAFALIPYCDDVFAELTDLPPVQVPAWTERMEYERIREISGDASRFIDFVAGAMGGDHVLMVDRTDHRADLELLMLLLPPRLRDRLTFQTCAYQPPMLPRRVTCVDAFHASLRQGSWSLVLPDQADRLTLKPANRFAEFLTVPERLNRAHELYARLDANDTRASLSAEASRLMRLADFSVVLDRKVATDAIRLIAKASGSEARVALAELETRFDSDTVAEALSALLETGADEDGLDQFLALSAGTPNTDVYHRAVLDALLRTHREPAVNLGASLLRWAAGLGDADRVVLLLGAFRRSGIAAMVGEAGTGAIAQYIASRASRTRVRPLEAAVSAVRAGTEILPLLKETIARQLVASDCTTVVSDAMRAAALTAIDTRGLLALQAAVDAAPAALADEIGRIVATDVWLESLTQADAERYGAAIGAEAGTEWVGLVCTTLVARAATANAELRINAGAAAFGMLNEHADKQVGRRVAMMVEQLGVREADLLAEPALQPALSFLGDFARNASFAARIADAAAAVLSNGNGAAGALAELALAARIDRIDTSRGGRVHTALVNALSAARERGETVRSPAHTELVLDLLAYAVEPTAFAALEEAAFGRTGGLNVRLPRLDRAILQARSATDEVLYDAIARILESDDSPVESVMRRRLRDALGTAGLHRRVMDAFNQALSRSIQ